MRHWLEPQLNLQKARKYISAQAESEFASVVLETSIIEVLLDKSKLLALDNFLIENILRIALRKLKGNLEGIEAVHLDRAVLELRKNQVGNRTPFIKELHMIIKSDCVVIAEGELDKNLIGPYEFELELSGVQEFAEIGWSIEIEVTDGSYHEAKGCLEAQLDFDKIVQPLYLRNRRPGDILTPLGMRGSKKLQDLFVDAKIPRVERDSIPIICDQEGILWVVGLRMSERGRVTSQTNKTLRLCAAPMNRSEKRDA